MNTREERACHLYPIDDDSRLELEEYVIADIIERHGEIAINYGN